MSPLRSTVLRATAWALRFKLNPENDADSAQDLDGDGYTNLEEYVYGTDPRVAGNYRIRG